MSIKHRIQDTIILNNIGRKDGALLSVLVAVAATSRIRYPEGTASNWKPGRDMQDGEAFQTFLGEESESVYGKGIRLRASSPCPDPDDPSAPAKNLSHPAIMYKYVRCELVHAGKLPHTIEFRTYTDGALHTEFIASENKFVFSDNWLARLIRVVIMASENDGSFDEERQAGIVSVELKTRFTFSREYVMALHQQLGNSNSEAQGICDATISFQF